MGMTSRRTPARSARMRASEAKMQATEKSRYEYLSFNQSQGRVEGAALRKWSA